VCSPRIVFDDDVVGRHVVADESIANDRCVAAFCLAPPDAISTRLVVGETGRARTTFIAVCPRGRSIRLPRPVSAEPLPRTTIGSGCSGRLDGAGRSQARPGGRGRPLEHSSPITRRGDEEPPPARFRSDPKSRTPQIAATIRNQALPGTRNF
jgi:hypothetical protein